MDDAVSCGSPAPLTSATELVATPSNVMQHELHRHHPSQHSGQQSQRLHDTARRRKNLMFDFMVAAKAELEKHCAADSPTASGRDEPGGGAGSVDEATPPGALPDRAVERFCRGGGGASEPVE